MRDEDLTPLGRKIEARKDELDLTQRDIARHASTYAKLVTGDGGNVERRIWRRAFLALRWDPDSVPTALAGGEPRPLKLQARTDAERDPIYAVEDAGAVFEGIAGATADERRIVLEILERGRRRLHERADRDNDRANGT